MVEMEKQDFHRGRNLYKNVILSSQSPKQATREAGGSLSNCSDLLRSPGKLFHSHSCEK